MTERPKFFLASSYFMRELTGTNAEIEAGNLWAGANWRRVKRERRRARKRAEQAFDKNRERLRNVKLPRPTAFPSAQSKDGLSEDWLAPFVRRGATSDAP
jgi:hypothetical protein